MGYCLYRATLRRIRFGGVSTIFVNVKYHVDLLHGAHRRYSSAHIGFAAFCTANIVSPVIIRFNVQLKKLRCISLFDSAIGYSHILEELDSIEYD
jgi:hypothetical protein